MKGEKDILSLEKECLTPLKFTEYSEYFEAIVADSSLYVEALLTKAGPVEAYRLANAEFDFDDVSCPLFRAEVERGGIQITLPLHVAVTNLALSVSEVLLKHGANIPALDSSQNNILHACVITAFYHPEIEKRLCDALLILMKHCDKAMVKRLMVEEDRDGLRPLEQATQQGALQLMSAFSMGEHLHVRTEYHGMTKYTWHDVTEYESPRRYDRSPMLLLTYMDRGKAREAAKHFLHCPFFGEWIKAKVRLNAIPMAAWAALRFLFVLTYFLLDRDDGYLRKAYDELEDSGFNISRPCFTDMNTFSGNTLRLMGLCMLLYSLISVLFDIIEIVKMMATKDYKKGRNLNGWKDLIVKVFFYRMCTFAVSLSILTMSCMFQLNNVEGSPVIVEASIQVISACRIVIPICSCWSLMYFMQALPYVGRSIVTIQGMLIDMANFLLLWCLVMLPFIHAFNVLVNTHTTQGCIAEFDGVGNTMYTLFRMMLNMVDLTQYELVRAHFFYLLHVVYVFMVAIILVNFLIAMMSESASRSAENEVITNWLNSLSIAVTIQQRFGAWLLRPYYSVMLPRVYTRDKQGRLCIVTRTNRREDIWRRFGKEPLKARMSTTCNGGVEQPSNHHTATA